MSLPVTQSQCVWVRANVPAIRLGIKISPGRPGGRVRGAFVCQNGRDLIGAKVVGVVRVISVCTFAPFAPVK